MQSGDEAGGGESADGGTAGGSLAFGRIAADYVRGHPGWPDRLYQKLATVGIGEPGERVADLGTGAGHFGRGFARRGCLVTGIDTAAPLMAEGEWLDARAGVKIGYRVAPAEATGLIGRSYGVVCAGGAWPWFQGAVAAREALRLLRPGGWLAIVHFDWLARPGTAAAATEALIRSLVPGWRRAGDAGLHPGCLTDIAAAGFQAIETFSFDQAVDRSHDAWRAWIRAAEAAAGGFDAALAERIDARLAALLARDFPGDSLPIPHRCWAVTARAAVSSLPGA